MAYPQPNSNDCWTGSLKEMLSIYTLLQVNKLSTKSISLEEKDMAPEVQWSNWTSLGNPPNAELGRPYVQRNQDGRLEVFANGAGRIFNVWQIAPNGGWNDGWHTKDSPSPTIGIISHVVGKNADGRLEIFAIGDD